MPPLSPAPPIPAEPASASLRTISLDDSEHLLHNHRASVASLRLLFAFAPERRSASFRNRCSPSPECPVGFPKLPKPSTRSPGFSSWSVAEGSASGGLLARSESGAEPGYDRGGWGALRSLGIGLFLIRVIFHCSFQEAREAPFDRLFSFYDAGLWIGVDKMLAPFRETVKI
jgi:hypothetical protein